MDKIYLSDMVDALFDSIIENLENYEQGRYVRYKYFFIPSFKEDDEDDIDKLCVTHYHYCFNKNGSLYKKSPLSGYTFDLEDCKNFSQFVKDFYDAFSSSPKMSEAHRKGASFNVTAAISVEQLIVGVEFP